jgi:hypothetical protein
LLPVGLNSLDTVQRVRTLVAFPVGEHNTKMPHDAFRGQTPDEVFVDRGPNPPDRPVAFGNWRVAHAGPKNA